MRLRRSPRRTGVAIIALGCALVAVTSLVSWSGRAAASTGFVDLYLNPTVSGPHAVEAEAPLTITFTITNGTLAQGAATPQLAIEDGSPRLVFSTISGWSCTATAAITYDELCSDSSTLAAGASTQVPVVLVAGSEPINDYVEAAATVSDAVSSNSPEGATTADYDTATLEFPPSYPGAAPAGAFPQKLGSDIQAGYLTTSTTFTWSDNGTPITLYVPPNADFYGPQVAMYRANSTLWESSASTLNRTFADGYAIVWGGSDGTTIAASTPVTITVHDSGRTQSGQVYAVASTGLGNEVATAQDGVWSAAFTSGSGFVVLYGTGATGPTGPTGSTGSTGSSSSTSSSSASSVPAPSPTSYSSTSGSVGLGSSTSTQSNPSSSSSTELSLSSTSRRASVHGPKVEITQFSATHGVHGQLVLKATTKNIGTKRATPTVTGFYLARNGAMHKLSSSAVPALEPHASATEDADVALPADLAPGSYSVIACANITMRDNMGKTCTLPALTVDVHKRNARSVLVTFSQPQPPFLLAIREPVTFGASGRMLPILLLLLGVAGILIGLVLVGLFRPRGTQLTT